MILACRSLLYLVGLLCLALTPGCVSLEHAFSEEPFEIYGGTSRCWAYITDNSQPVFGSIVRTVDFPATLILDTLLLPISVPVELTR